MWSDDSSSWVYVWTSRKEACNPEYHVKHGAISVMILAAIPAEYYSAGPVL